MTGLLENLSYDPTTGVFEWLKIPMGQTRKRAGYASPDGYVHIRIRRKLYKAHRLAWLAVHGEMPTGELDHINGDKGDNRIDNLRVATSSQNKWNTRRHRDNKSGFKGVSLHAGTGKWIACISVHKRYIYLGLFDSPEEASRTYQAAAKQHFGAFAREIKQ